MAGRSKRPVVESFSSAGHLKWDVRWVVKKGKRWIIIVRPFDSDLSGAIELYQKALRAGRHYVTLRCRNSGFPPPEKLRPYWGEKKVKEERWVRRKGKRVKKLVTTIKPVYRVPMRRRNREGQWWCPYCREMREFVHAYELPYIHPPIPSLGHFKPEPEESGLYCPMCYISTRDHNVRKWNPLAERF